MGVNNLEGHLRKELAFFFFIDILTYNIKLEIMLTIHTITKKSQLLETDHNVYIGSSGNKFIFNVAPSNEPKPAGGYTDLRHICYMHGIEMEDVKSIVKKAEEIMGRTLAENMAAEK